VIPSLGYVGALSDRHAMASRLSQAGLGSKAAAARADLFAMAWAALQAGGTAGHALPAAFFVPGRIEVLGKHTDYAGGRSMVVATEQGFSLVAVARGDRRIAVIDAVAGESIEFDFAPDLAPSIGHWSNYPMTVARRLARNFPGSKRGATMALASDLPIAAGMSSSSALMVAAFLGLAAVNDLYRRREFRDNVHGLLDLAGYLGTVENGQSYSALAGDRGVGTFGGSEDHTAMLCSQAGHLSQFAYCPARFERTIPLPAGYTFAVAVSGVVAEKTGAAMEKYNAASRLASTLAELWRRHTGGPEPHLAAILESGPDAVGRLRQIVRSAALPDGDRLLRRLAHFVAENEEILPLAGDCLARGDIASFGDLAGRSQRAAEDLLGNQTPETSHLAESAKSCGAVAASAFGAGFGGSVWALVAEASAQDFVDSWSRAYGSRFPESSQSSEFFTTSAGRPAFALC